MNLDEETSSTPHELEEMREYIIDESSVPHHASRTSTISLKALFLAFIQEIPPELRELLERFDCESDQLKHDAAAPTDQQAAVLQQEAIIESEQFTSNAIVRVLEDYQTIVVDGKRISLDHKQRIIFRALVERHRKGDYSFVTAAQLATVIAKDYQEKLWTNLDKDDVVRVYSRLRRDISSKATSTIIEHNGTCGPYSGYRLSIPPDNILLAQKADAENR